MDVNNRALNPAQPGGGRGDAAGAADARPQVPSAPQTTIGHSPIRLLAPVAVFPTASSQVQQPVWQRQLQLQAHAPQSIVSLLHATGQAPHWNAMGSGQLANQPSALPVSMAQPAFGHMVSPGLPWAADVSSSLHPSTLKRPLENPTEPAPKRQKNMEAGNAGALVVAKPDAAQVQDKRPLAERLRDCEARFNAAVSAGNSNSMTAAVHDACVHLRAAFESNRGIKNNPTRIGHTVNDIALRNPIFAARLRVHTADSTIDDKNMYFRRAILCGGKVGEAVRSHQAIAQAWINNMPFSDPPTRDQLIALLITPGDAGGLSTQCRIKEVLAKLAVLQSRNREPQAFRDQVGSILRSSIHLSPEYVETMRKWIGLPSWLRPLLEPQASPGTGNWNGPLESQALQQGEELAIGGRPQSPPEPDLTILAHEFLTIQSLLRLAGEDWPDEALAGKAMQLDASRLCTTSAGVLQFFRGLEIAYHSPQTQADRQRVTALLDLAARALEDHATEVGNSSTGSNLGLWVGKALREPHTLEFITALFRHVREMDPPAVFCSALCTEAWKDGVQERSRKFESLEALIESSLNRDLAEQQDVPQAQPQFAPLVPLQPSPQQPVPINIRPASWWAPELDAGGTNAASANRAVSPARSDETPDPFSHLGFDDWPDFETPGRTTTEERAGVWGNQFAAPVEKLSPVNATSTTPDASYDFAGVSPNSPSGQEETATHPQLPPTDERGLDSEDQRPLPGRSERQRIVQARSFNTASTRPEVSSELETEESSADSPRPRTRADRTGRSANPQWPALHEKLTAFGQQYAAATTRKEIKAIVKSTADWIAASVKNVSDPSDRSQRMWTIAAFVNALTNPDDLDMLFATSVRAVSPARRDDSTLGSMLYAGSTTMDRKTKSDYVGLGIRGVPLGQPPSERQLASLLILAEGRLARRGTHAAKQAARKVMVDRLVQAFDGLSAEQKKQMCADIKSVMASHLYLPHRFCRKFSTENYGLPPELQAAARDGYRQRMADRVDLSAADSIGPQPVEPVEATGALASIAPPEQQWFSYNPTGAMFTPLPEAIALSEQQWFSYTPPGAMFAPLPEVPGARGVGRLADVRIERSGNVRSRQPKDNAPVVIDVPPVQPVQPVPADPNSETSPVLPVMRPRAPRNEADARISDEARAAVRRFPGLSAWDVHDIREFLDENRYLQFSVDRCAQQLGWTAQLVTQAIAAMLMGQARTMHNMHLDNSSFRAPKLQKMICESLHGKWHELRPFVINNLVPLLPPPGQ